MKFGNLCVLAALAAGTVSTPASGSPNSAAMDALAADYRDMVDAGKRAGIVSLVWHDGRIVHSQAVGQRDIGRGLPMTENTIFRIYSMSRIVTAALIMRLADEGSIDLASPVARYLPEFAGTRVIVSANGSDLVTGPQREPVLVHQLMNYTAGLGYARDYPAAVGITRDDVFALEQNIGTGIRKLAGYPLLLQPGERWHYGFHSDVLGRIGEVQGGARLDILLRDKLLEPLNMPDTGFSLPEEDATRLARIYGPGESPGSLKDVTNNAPKSSNWVGGTRMLSGGGGIATTATDYLKFLRMLLAGGEANGQRILSGSAIEAMLTNQIDAKQGPLYWYEPDRGKPGDSRAWMNGYGWGYGVSVRLAGDQHTIPGTPGDFAWGGLAGTTFFADPHHQVIAIALSQYLGPDGGDLMQTLRRRVYEYLAPDDQGLSAGNIETGAG